MHRSLTPASSSLEAPHFGIWDFRTQHWGEGQLSAICWVTTNGKITDPSLTPHPHPHQHCLEGLDLSIRSPPGWIPPNPLGLPSFCIEVTTFGGEMQAGFNGKRSGPGDTGLLGGPVPEPQLRGPREREGLEGILRVPLRPF